MRHYIKVQFGEETPKDGQEVFCIVTGEMMLLEYQSKGYPLYDRSTSDTVPYMLHDHWLKEIEDEEKTTS